MSLKTNLMNRVRTAGARGWAAWEMGRSCFLVGFALASRECAGTRWGGACFTSRAHSAVALVTYNVDPISVQYLKVHSKSCPL